MPIISDIVQQKKKKNYYSVFIDNEYSFSLSEADLNFLQLKINDNIPQEKLNSFINLYSIQKAKDYAYSLISRKSYSEKEFYTKLIQKFPEKTVQIVIQDLK